MALDDPTAVGRRIKELRRANGLTQKEFAESLGIVQGFLSSIERGTKTPSDTLQIALCRTYGVSREWLLTGRGGKRAGGVTAPSVPVAPRGAGTPLLGRVSRGFSEGGEARDVIGQIALPGIPAGCFAIVVYGDYMAPTIRDGDLAIFTPGGVAENGFIVLVTNRWDEAILRRYREKEGEIFFSPDNAAYAPFQPDPDTRIIGTVVQVWRNVRI